MVRKNYFTDFVLEQYKKNHGRKYNECQVIYPIHHQVCPFRSNFTDSNLPVNWISLKPKYTSSSANFILCSVHMNVFLAINVLRTSFYAF